MIVEGYLGLDVGGTGAKAGVFDESGKLLGTGQVAYVTSSPGEGMAEIDIEEIYAAARESVASAVRSSGAMIRAMAISSQGQTFVTLDKHDRPLHPAILWYDSRATAHADEMKSRVLESSPKSPVPTIEAIASAPKILWLRENNPDVISRARRFLLLPDYFSYRLTGEAVTDPNTASSTGLYADDADDYSPEALIAAEIDKSEIAEIRPTGTRVARVLPAMAEDWGLRPETLLVTGTNDQYAGALGAGNCRPGIVSETTGTCLALVTLTQHLPTTMPVGLLGGRFPIPRYNFLLATSKTAGVVLQWFQSQFCHAISLRELDKMASAVPIGSNGVTISPHFDGIVSPVPNPEARGFICNLSLHHTVADIYRGILESISFCLCENLEALQETGLKLEVIRCIGGGAKSDVWTQIKADVTGLAVERPVVTEAATFGAAMIAAVGAGKFHSLEESSASLCHIERVFEPHPKSHACYLEPYQRYRRQCSRIYA